ncbi:Hypothetical protein R9X50_00390800 [Acrodontium crateriforme]|uniref:Nucleoporin NDC1 n=1 Tax=Acrodontium crateriforme TaxID=150365 RepID=A0AAQ3M6L9_9PEZI|nr:Hypothetical protein R9X50_00390800 [Acrodontium crateriforme]
MSTRTATSLHNGALITSQAATTAESSKSPVAQVARPYKDFLTPALHRRFTKASAVLLILCWVEATLMSHAGWFWSWFPLSLTGLRALVLFVPCLAVFIVRVANLHVGKRAAASQFDGLMQDLASVRAAAALVWYCFSGWFFGEIYIWTRGEGSGLGWIDLGRPYERARMNENPVYLRALFVFLAVVQATLHLTRDTDRLPIDTHEPTVAKEEPAPRLPVPLQQLAAQGGTIMGNAVKLTIFGVVFIAPVYFLLLRSSLWSVTFWFARRYFRQLPENSDRTGLANLPTLLWQCLSSSFMLALLWEISNAAFTILVTEAPLKKGQPLTSEIQDASGVIISKSKDPNGSLIRGLKAKKEVPKSFAFWELNIICSNFAARRKTIFTEVDRSKDLGTTWNQVSSLCLAELTSISARIQAAQQPLESKKKADEKALQLQQHENLMPTEKQESLGLPKIGSGTLDNRAIFQQPKTNNDFVHTIGGVAKSLGQSPGAVNPVLPRARRAAKWVADEALSKEAQYNILNPRFGPNNAAIEVLNLAPAQIFRHTFARRACAVIFGIPHSNQLNIVHAARSLARMAVCSLKEDDYGQVAKSVPSIVRTFSTAITDIEAFVAGLAPSWTDVTFVSPRDRRVEEVEEVLAVLREGLEEVLLAFAEYASAIGLTKKDIRDAREAVVGKAGGMEMVKT